MNTPTSQPRQPKGVPVGGQFAATVHAEADLTLEHGPAIDPRPMPWGETSYEFPRWAEEKAIRSIETANRRAEKAGIVDRFTYDIEHYERPLPDRDGSGVTRYEERTRLTLNRPTVEHDGWRFAATLTWDPEAGMVSRTVPGEALLERPEEKRCDVCNQPRNRRDTYVIQRDGVQMQVGSDCLEQFLGIKPQGLWMLDFEPVVPETDDDLGGGYGSAGDVRYDTRDLLRIGLAVVREHGWVPRSASDERRPATADLVGDVLENRPCTDAQRHWIEHIRAEAAGLGTEADEALALARDLDGDSDYAFNLRAAAAPDTVTWRNAPLVLSAIGAVHKRQQAEARKKTTAASQHLGKPKDKIEGHQVEILATKPIDGFRGGVTTIVTMIDGDGNVLKWFATGRKDFQPGQKFTAKATIKAHDEYQGVKETVITRATLDPAD